MPITYQWKSKNWIIDNVLWLDMTEVIFWKFAVIMLMLLLQTWSARIFFIFPLQISFLNRKSRLHYVYVFFPFTAFVFKPHHITTQHYDDPWPSFDDLHTSCVWCRHPHCRQSSRLRQNCRSCWGIRSGTYCSCRKYVL